MSSSNFRHVMIRILAVTAVAVFLVACPTQAPAPCQLQTPANGPYVVKFSADGGTAAGANCPATFGDLWQFDGFANSAIGMMSLSAVPLLPDPPDSDAGIYGKGTWKNVDPDSNNLCFISFNTFDSLRPDPASTDGGTLPVTFAVHSATFLSGSAFIGTEFTADVTFTAPGCSGSYTAQGLSPTIACSSNADCNPNNGVNSSGITPDYNQGCNMESWTDDVGGPVCFFNAPFPSLGGYKP